MRLALYLLNYYSWCQFMGFEFDIRTANSVAILYKSFRDTHRGRVNMNYTIREQIKKIKEGK